MGSLVDGERLLVKTLPPGVRFLTDVGKDCSVMMCKEVVEEGRFDLENRENLTHCGAWRSGTDAEKCVQKKYRWKFT